MRYSQAHSISGGGGPYTFELSSGALPFRLTLSSAGILSGTPKSSGGFQFVVLAVDGASCGGTKSFGGAVNAANTAIPTLAEWMLALLAGLLGSTGALLAARRQRPGSGA